MHRSLRLLICCVHVGVFSADLHSAAKVGQLEHVLQLVPHASADQLNGALEAAAKFGHSDVAAALLRGGAMVNSHNKRGVTPLMHAAYSGNCEVVLLLVREGADVEQRSKLGNALDHARDRLHERTVQVLEEVTVARQNNQPLPLLERCHGGNVEAAAAAERANRRREEKRLQNQEKQQQEMQYKERQVAKELKDAEEAALKRAEALSSSEWARLFLACWDTLVSPPGVYLLNTFLVVVLGGAIMKCWLPTVQTKATEVKVRAELAATQKAARKQGKWNNLARSIEDVDCAQRFFVRRQPRDARAGPVLALNPTYLVQQANPEALKSFVSSGKFEIDPMKAYERGCDTLLFHGTSEAAVANIITTGRPSLEFAKSGMLGTGIYGASDPRKSLQYCNSQRKFMLICRFNLANVKHAGPKTAHRNSVFDEFCVYTDAHVVVLWVLKLQ